MTGKIYTREDQRIHENLFHVVKHLGMQRIRTIVWSSGFGFDLKIGFGLGLRVRFRVRVLRKKRRRCQTFWQLSQHFLNYRNNHDRNHKFRFGFGSF